MSEFESNLELGQMLRLSFNERIGNGYMWEYDGVQNLIVTQWRKQKNDNDSSSSSAHYLLNPSLRGEYAVTFRHRRPWENIPIETLTYKLNVQL